MVNYTDILMDIRREGPVGAASTLRKLTEDVIEGYFTVTQPEEHGDILDKYHSEFEELFEAIARKHGLYPEDDEEPPIEHVGDFHFSQFKPFINQDEPAAIEYTPQDR